MQTNKQFLFFLFFLFSFAIPFCFLLLFFFLTCRLSTGHFIAGRQYMAAQSFKKALKVLDVKITITLEFSSLTNGEVQFDLYKS
jgi:hypothetical protein